jgi:TPR repeat protein
MNAALRAALAALAPKLEALAATEEVAALYLYADKLRKDGRAAESVAVFEKAAQREHAPSMLQLGLVLSNAPDKATSLPRAAHWFKMGDSKGYAQATFALGECYLDGKGVPRDYDLALQHLEAAAAKDIAEAHFTLGTTYLGLMPADLAAGDDFDPAKLNPGLTGEPRLRKARGHLETAAQRSLTPAGGVLARMLLNGEGGPRDVARGVKVLDEATRQPNPDASHLRILAYLLLPNSSAGLPTREELQAAQVKPEPKRAEELMRQAARMGDGPARLWCSENGVAY